jgi:uncharacterized membrane protein
VELSGWLELLIAILVLLADFWAGAAWKQHQLQRQGPPHK